MNNNTLINSALIITILTGFFYLVGISNYRGFLSEFGLSEYLLSISFNEIILNGVLRTLAIISQPIRDYPVASLLVIVGITLLSLFFMLLDKKFEIASKQSEDKEKNATENEILQNKSDGVFALWGKFFYFLSLFIMTAGFLLFFIFIILGGIISLSQFDGKTQAIEIKENYPEDYTNQELESDIIEFSYGGDIINGVILGSSSDFLLIYNDEKGAIAYNLSKIEYISSMNQQNGL